MLNRLVTNGNTKLCCGAFILVLFHSTTTNKIDSVHKKFLLVCDVEILQVTVKKYEEFSSLRLISDDVWIKSAEKKLKMVPWFLVDVHKDG